MCGHGRPAGSGSPDVGPLAVFKTVRASLNSKSAPKDRNTDGFQTVWDSPFAGDCSRCRLPDWWSGSSPLRSGALFPQCTQFSNRRKADLGLWLKACQRQRGVASRGGGLSRPPERLEFVESPPEGGRSPARQPRRAARPTSTARRVASRSATPLLMRTFGESRLAAPAGCPSPAARASTRIG